MTEKQITGGAKMIASEKERAGNVKEVMKTLQLHAILFVVMKSSLEKNHVMIIR